MQIHEALERQHKARETLEACGVELGADFHTLSSNVVDMLLRAADRDKYRKPHKANGSRGRYYHDRLQRHARTVP